MSSAEGDPTMLNDGNTEERERKVPRGEVVTIEEGLLREKEILNLIKLLHIQMGKVVERPSSHVLYEGSSDELTQRNSAGGVVSSGMGYYSS